MLIHLSVCIFLLYFGIKDLCRGYICYCGWWSWVMHLHVYIYLTPPPLTSSFSLLQLQPTYSGQRHVHVHNDNNMKIIIGSVRSDQSRPRARPSVSCRLRVAGRAALRSPSRSMLPRYSVRHKTGHSQMNVAFCVGKQP